MTCGSIDEKSKELSDLLDSCDNHMTSSDKDKIMLLMVDIYKIGHNDGQYHASGPKINLYGDRKSDK